MRKFVVEVLPVSAAAAIAMGFTGSAHAVDFAVSGQVDRAFVFANNGKRSDAGSVDNNGSNSRFRFTGSQIMDNGMKLGFTYEIGLTQMPSSSWDIGQNSDGSVQLDTRKVEGYLESSFGTLSLGKGDGAGHYADTIDFSETNFLGGGVEYEDYNAGLTFVDGAGNHHFTVGTTQSDFDAFSRVSRVRYDSPSLNGFVLSTSFDNGHAYELAARYKRNFPGGTKFAAGMSWDDGQDRNIPIDPGTGSGYNGTLSSRILNGSASLQLSNNLIFTVSAARDYTANITGEGTKAQAGFDATNYFGQIGYQFGRHNFAINYGVTYDYEFMGNKGQQFGAAYVFDWTKTVQLYTSYHLYTLDLPSYVKTGFGLGNQKDLNVVFSGVRIKFM